MCVGKEQKYRLVQANIFFVKKHQRIGYIFSIPYLYLSTHTPISLPKHTHIPVSLSTHTHTYIST